MASFINPRSTVVVRTDWRQEKFTKATCIARLTVPKRRNMREDWSKGWIYWVLFQGCHEAEVKEFLVEHALLV